MAPASIVRRSRTAGTATSGSSACASGWRWPAGTGSSYRCREAERPFVPRYQGSSQHMENPVPSATPIAIPRVLVVDDDVMLGGALCDLLRQKGFDVVGQASSGPEAVALSRDTEPDVVLMDFRMPRMDGLE